MGSTVTYIKPDDEWRVAGEPPSGECGISDCPCHQWSRQKPATAATADQQPLWVDAATVRAAMLDVIDTGNPDDFDGWLFYLVESDRQTERRVRFLDAVIARIRQLQQLPHNATNLADYCDHHKRRRLGPPTRQVCIDCQEGRQ